MRIVVLLIAIAACNADTATDDECADIVVGEGFASELSTAVAANAWRGGGIFRIECTSGRLLWEGAAGNVAMDDATSLRPDDAFEIQSTTKAFTSALALTFVEDRSIGLDDPVSDVLPDADVMGLLVIDGHDYGPELTLRQLLAQTG